MIQRLLDRLHRVFDKEPHGTPAITCYAPTGSVATIARQTLSLATSVGGVTIPISNGNLSDVVDGLNNCDLNKMLVASFTRASVANKIDGTQVPANTPRYESGPNGNKAIYIEEGTTNLCPSDMAEANNISQFIRIGGDQWYIQSGQVHIHSDARTTNLNFTTAAVPITADTVYSASLDLTITSATTDVYVKFNTYNASNVVVSSKTVLASKYITGKQRVKIENLNSGTGAVTAKIQIIQVMNKATISLLADNFQIEQKAYSTTYINGTRAGESHSIEGCSSLLSFQEFTVEAWVNPTPRTLPSQVRASVLSNWHTWDSAKQKGFLLSAGFESSWIPSFIVNNNTPVRYTAESSIPIIPGQWTHLTGVFKGGQYAAIFVNGELAGINTNVPASCVFENETIKIGYSTINSGWFNGAIGPIRFTRLAKSSDQIKESASQSRMIWDESTTAIFRYNDLYSTPIEASVAANMPPSRLARGISPLTESAENGVITLSYPTSQLYQEMQTNAWALEGQEAQIASAEKQLYMDSAEGAWLDYWCDSFFGIPRFSGESDEQYITRVKHEIIRATQNNTALAIIVKESIGVTIKLIDAVPHVAELPPEEQANAPGRFILDMSIPNELSPADAQILIDRIKDIVRRYKAAGTDFIDALRKLCAIAETASPKETHLLTVTHTTYETPVAGPIRVGAGWRVGTPGLCVGNNTAIKEQLFVKKILAADSSTESFGLYGG